MVTRNMLHLDQPGMMVRSDLALLVSQMWCCSRYVSRVVLPITCSSSSEYERRVGWTLRK
jgi:hypothetical protein